MNKTIINRSAEQFLKEKGLNDLPIDPFYIAKLLEIEVISKSFEDVGVSGMLLRSGNSFAIVYATHIKNEGFKRFSVAHELGHYILPEHPQKIFTQGVSQHLSRAGFQSIDQLEKEADQFAAALLMPSILFTKASNSLRMEGLEAIRELATLCQTSLLATAIRYVETVSIPVAMISSCNGRIDFCKISATMAEFRIQSLPKGTPLPRGTRTELLHRDQELIKNYRGDEAKGDLQDWFGGTRSIPIYEEVIGLGAYGKALTILTTDFELDEIEEEEKLVESWTPTFRR